MNHQQEPQSRLKQRLTGVIVLVALGVIFIPMILDGEREREFLVNGSSVPPVPAGVEQVRQFEFPPAPAADSESAEEIRIPVDERSAPLPPPVQAVKPKVADKGEGKTPQAKHEPAPPRSSTAQAAAKPVVHAWAVQAGSFKQKANALKLRDRLRKQQFKAFVEAVRGRDGLVYRVRLGPYVKRADAERVQARLQARQKLKGLVVRHP